MSLLQCYAVIVYSYNIIFTMAPIYSHLLSSCHRQLILDCTDDGAAANTTVEVVPLPLPCTMKEEGMTLADVVECPTHSPVIFGFGNWCNCYVPKSETCPEQPSPASIGALLSKTVSFGLGWYVVLLLVHVGTLKMETCFCVLFIK